MTPRTLASKQGTACAASPAAAVLCTALHSASDGRLSPSLTASHGGTFSHLFLTSQQHQATLALPELPALSRPPCPFQDIFSRSQPENQYLSRTSNLRPFSNQPHAQHTIGVLWAGLLHHATLLNHFWIPISHTGRDSPYFLCSRLKIPKCV